MLLIKEAQTVDLPFITKVYNFYIANSTATFHTEQVDSFDMEKSLPFNHDKYKTYIIKYDKQAAGYCYIGNYKPRQAYDRTAEVTIYLMPEFFQKGIGKQALSFLEEEAKIFGFKNLLGIITAENEGSVRLFKKAGYSKVAHFKNIGEKFGRILDVVGYQKEI